MPFYPPPKGLSVVLVKPDGTLRSPLKKLLSVSDTDELLRRTGAKAGDLLLMAAGSLHSVVRHTSHVKRSARGLCVC